MKVEVGTFRQSPSQLLIGVVLILLLASWASMALAAGGGEAANPYAAAWERYLAGQTPEDMGARNIGAAWTRFWDMQNLEPVGGLVVRYDPFEARGAGSLVLDSGRDAYVAAWQRYLALQTPEALALGNLGDTWARFWDTQNLEPVGGLLVRYDGEAAFAGRSAFEAANPYASAWQSFVATQNPQSLAPGNFGTTWALFWANVQAGGLVETDEGFEVICCR